jgi:hypothetical protein
MKIKALCQQNLFHDSEKNECRLWVDQPMEERTVSIFEQRCRTSAKRAALEELCLAVVRRLPDLEDTERVAIVAIDAPPDQPNWLLGHIDRFAPITESSRRRVEQALEVWRQRYCVEA